MRFSIRNRKGAGIRDDDLDVIIAARIRAARDGSGFPFKGSPLVVAAVGPEHVGLQDTVRQVTLGSTVAGMVVIVARGEDYGRRVNTANGANALYSNTLGVANTASGREALYSNTTGSQNRASGSDAMLFNTAGSTNTATR